MSWPRNRYRRPIFDVRVPRKNVNPMSNIGRVVKASPIEPLKASKDSIYRHRGRINWPVLQEL
jgi:hypothetical protein